jgi:hypothetical protein
MNKESRHEETERGASRIYGQVIAFIDIPCPKPHFQRTRFYDLMITAL